MAEAGGSYSNMGGRYPYFYGPEGRLVLVDSALENVSRGSTTIGIRTPSFALLASHIKPVRPLVDPAEKIFAIDGHVGATGNVTGPHLHLEVRVRGGGIFYALWEVEVLGIEGVR